MRYRPASLSSITSVPGQPVYALDGSFDSRSVDSAQTTLIGSTGSQLYSLEESSAGSSYEQTGSSLYSINPTTGAASLVGDFGLTLSFNLAISAFGSAGHLLEFGTNIGTNSTVYRVDPACVQGAAIQANSAAEPGAASLIGLGILRSFLYRLFQLFQVIRSR